MRNIPDPRYGKVAGVWQSLYALYPRGRRRGMQAEVRLKGAYQNVFFGSPTREDQAIVLADLLNKSGFQRVTDARGTTDQELWQAEGARRLYAETVFANVNLPEAEMRALENAARMEAAIDTDPKEQRN